MRQIHRMKPHVLIVEDDALNAMLFREFLQSKGFYVTLLGDGIHVLETVEKTRPDLIIMDIGLPTISGLDIIRQLKQQARTADIPIVALSGYTNDNLLDAIIEAGVDARLSKPPVLADLEHTVRRHLFGDAPLHAAPPA